MNVIEFLEQFPQHELKYGVPVIEQPRVYDDATLSVLPLELDASFPARVGKGGRGKSRWNFNNTRTHYQCKTCLKVKRHDSFWSGASYTKQNLVSPHCKDCAAVEFAAYYEANGEELAEIRHAIWRYLAPSCILCGYDRHPVAMDMHHLGDKEGNVSRLVTMVAQGINEDNSRRLIEEANKCVPLCGNCHRLLHAGIVEIPDSTPRRVYDSDTLRRIARKPKRVM